MLPASSPTLKSANPWLASLSTGPATAGTSPTPNAPAAVRRSRVSRRGERSAMRPPSQ